MTAAARMARDAVAGTRRLTIGAARPERLCAVLLAGSLLWAWPAGATPWTRSYINSLPDSAFAVVEVRPDGKKVRHLPHHDRTGRLDLPHLRNALSRLPQVEWIDPAHADVAEQHLRQHWREVQRRRAEHR